MGNGWGFYAICGKVITNIIDVTVLMTWRYKQESLVHISVICTLGYIPLWSKALLAMTFALPSTPNGVAAGWVADIAVS